MIEKHHWPLWFNGFAWAITGLGLAIYGILAEVRPAMLTGIVLQAAGLLLLGLYDRKIRRKR